MKTILETDRLIVREFLPSDVTNIFKLNSDKKVMQYTGDKIMQNTKEAEKLLTEEIIENQYEKQGYGRWAVHLKANGLFIGWAGLRKEEEQVNLGFRFHKRFWDKGFGTEVGKAIVEYGFNTLNINEILGRTSKENLSSQRMLEKIGMLFDSEHKEANTIIYYYKITN